MALLEPFCMMATNLARSQRVTAVDEPIHYKRKPSCCIDNVAPVMALSFSANSFGTSGEASVGAVQPGSAVPRVRYRF